MNKNLLAALAVVLTMIGCTYWINRQNAAAEAIRCEQAVRDEYYRQREEDRRRYRAEDEAMRQRWLAEDQLDELRRIREGH
jgi:flagellar motility protein MotE (MotC chaperone)